MQTITYSENNKGWTSFWRYFPDGFLNLNNKFLTIKNGQLWLQNDIDNPVRNNFYGTQDKTSIKTVFNEASADDKIFKTLALESNEKWKATLKTNLTQGEIKKEEFNTRESRQFSFIRGDQTPGSLSGNSAQGIGVILSYTGLVISFATIPDLINIGDQLYQINVSNQELIGAILSIDRNNNTITLNQIIAVPVPGLYSYSLKNSRIEGEEMRGYYMEVTLENEDSTNGELFAISSNIVQSLQIT
jgi:hypothetical protein